jgi:hypothetical protein
MKIKQKKRLLKEFEKLTDFRTHFYKIKYKLSEILFMSVFALLKGNSTYQDIQIWMIHNKENTLFLKLFEKDKIKIPSRSTLHNILINTDNNELESVFRAFFLPYINQKNIAIDGKWLNGSNVNGQYTKMSHKAVLNILDKDTKIVIGHKFISKKNSEIPAFSEFLDDDLFSKDEQIFSFDALLTQIKILNKINLQGKKYI